VLWKHQVPIPSDGPDAIRGYEMETFLEFGTQVCILNGFSLQWILTAIIALERLAYDPTGILVAATYGDNLRAANNFLNAMHFVEWTDVPATWDSLRLHHMREAGDEARGLRWFRPTGQTIAAAADLLLELCERPNRKASARLQNPEIAEIIFNFDAISFQRIAFDDLKEMARKLSSVRPVSLAALRSVLDNETVSENFIHWPDS
jgi:hypothetical protein